MKSHDFLMSKLIEQIIYDGGTAIRAYDFGDFECPKKIVLPTSQVAHVPDVTAIISGKEFIYEVETAESLFSDHTRSQLELFGAYARQANAVCCLVVPKKVQIHAMLHTAINLRSLVQVLAL